MVTNLISLPNLILLPGLGLIMLQCNLILLLCFINIIITLYSWLCLEFIVECSCAVWGVTYIVRFFFTAADQIMQRANTVICVNCTWLHSLVFVGYWS